MLRAAVAALLLANVLFFAWARGWLSPAVPPPHAGEREPGRLAAQIRPETIRLVTPQAASAAVAAANAVCMEAGPFGDTDIGVAEAAVLAAGVPANAFERRDVVGKAAWLVYMGRFADAAAQRTKEDELRRLKLGFEPVTAPAELAPGLQLSRHDSREAADAALALAGAARRAHRARGGRARAARPALAAPAARQPRPAWRGCAGCSRR